MLIEKDKISLRPVDSNDFAVIETWLSKEYIKKWYGDPAEWLAEIKNENGMFNWINHYIVMYENTPMGFCQYYDCSKTPRGFEWDNEPIRTHCIDYLIGEEAYLRKGLGSAIIQKLCQHIIAFEKSVQLIADPVPENTNSIRLLIKNGFSLDANTGLYKHPVQ